MKSNIPPVKPVSKLTPLPVYESLLDNGLKAAGFFNDDVKVLKIDFVFEAGKAHQSKAYLAAFCNAMIREEKQTKHASGTEALLDYYGIFLQQKLQKHWSVFSFYVPVMYLNKFLPLAFSMLFEPEFTDESLHFIREKTRQNLRKNLQRTDFVADANLNNMIWGKDHPLGYYPTEQKLEHISIDDIKTFYETHYKTNCRIILSGFFPNNIHTLLNNYFGKSPTVYNDKTNHAQKSAAKNQHLQIPMENKSQVSIRWGQMCISPHHPDYFKFKVLNAVFGNYFGSRLMRNIREKKGYTYGINSSIIPSAYGCEFKIATDVGKNYLDDTITQIYKEAEILCHDKISEEELNLVKNYMSGELLRMFDGPFKHASVYRYLTEMHLYFDYFYDFLNHIKQISAEDILITAQHYLNLKDLHKITVGSIRDTKPSME
jgi:zinc protease